MPLCEAIVSLYQENGLSQLQLKPTREHSVLDLYFTNNASLVKGIHAIQSISDHDMIVVDSVIRPVIDRPVRLLASSAETSQN